MEINQNFSEDKSKLGNEVIENLSSSDFIPEIKQEDSYHENSDTDREHSIKSQDELEANDQELYPSNDDDDDDTRQMDTSEIETESITSSSNSNIKNLCLTNKILLDGNFFAIKSQNGRTLVAKCKVCKPRKYVDGTIDTSSNFRRHLKNHHRATTMAKVDKYIGLKKSALLQKNDQSYENQNDIDGYSISSKLTSTIETLVDGKFFKFKSRDGRSLVATCQLCKPPKDVKGAIDSTWNFQIHFKKTHGHSLFQDLYEYISLNKSRMKKNNDQSIIRNYKQTRQTKAPSPLCKEEVDTESTSSSNNSIMNSLSMKKQMFFDGTFFTLKSGPNKSKIATCTVCRPHRDLRGISNSNLRSHLIKNHGISILEELNKHISLKRSFLKEKSAIWAAKADSNLKTLSLTSQAILDGRFFAFKYQNKKSLVATCKLCKSYVVVRGNLDTSSNFKAHLLRYHGDSFVDELNEHIYSKRCQLKEESEEMAKNGENVLISSTNNDDDEEDDNAATQTASCKPSSNNSIVLSLSLTYQILFDGKYFTFERIMQTTKQKVMFAMCRLCNDHVSGDSISKFRLHLKYKHGNSILQKLNQYIRLEKSRLEECNGESRDIQSHTLPFSDPYKLDELQPTLTITTPTTTTTTALTVDEISLRKQMQFNANILNYFLQSFTPLNAVNSPAFWKMFDSFDEKRPQISEEDLYTQIDMMFNMLREKITSLLEAVKYVCTTTDLWSSKSQYYVTITCHWIDVVNFERKSVAMACKRFDTFTNEIHIDELLKETFNSYNLPLDKIVSNVTKNCYNFSQIFKDLNINTKVKTDIINDNNFPVSIQTKELLPIVCYTETLSCIATIDIPKAIKSDPSLRLINESTLKKVFLFLSLASSCPTLSPMLADLKQPHVAKWNSIYDAITYVCKLEQKRTFAELFHSVKLEPFTHEEVKYLREYVKCLHPLAMAFERLQCEQGTYQGFVLPALLEMRKKCEKLQQSNDVITICKPILKTILDESMKRFDEYFKPNPKSERVTIASLSHPFFKEKWVSAIDELQKNSVRTLFLDAVKTENSKSNDAAEEEDICEADRSKEEIDDFYFGEEEPRHNTKAKLSVEFEALRYLSDERRDLKMLDDYPAVKRVFLKYNTPLSSSEPFQKLFSYETRQDIARYDIMVDDLFEERVLLSVNKDELVL